VAFRALYLTLDPLFFPASGESSWSSPIEGDPEPPDLNVPNSEIARSLTAAATTVTNAVVAGRMGSIVSRSGAVLAPRGSLSHVELSFASFSKTRVVP
jgi:hypothetical protein